MSLTAQLRELGDTLPEDDKRWVLSRARDLRRDGMRNKDAELQAARDLLEKARRETGMQTGSPSGS